MAAVTLACFAPVLGADFVAWDDGISIFKNPNLGGLSMERLRWAFTDVDSTMRYIPLTLLSWSLTYDLWGLSPFGYHLGNWVLHGLSAALVFLVVRKLLLLRLARPGEVGADSWLVAVAAATGALLWSLHPLRVEPVAWATGRAYCQAAFFLFLSGWFYLRASEPGVAAGRRRLSLSASVVSYVASLLSHPIGVGFIGVLIVLDVYPLGRFAGGRGWWRSRTNRRAILEKLPFVAAALAVSVATIAVRIASAGVWLKPVSLEQFGLTERFMQAMYIWAYYGWRPWYPVDLAPVYTTLVSFDPLSLPFVASGLGVVGATAALVVLRRRWPLGLALGISHLVLLFPLTGLWEHPHYHSDRYSLVVSVTWSILLAAGLANPKMRAIPRMIVLTLAIWSITIFGAWTYHQSRVWTNSVTLFSHMIRTLGDDPYRSDIHWRLGAILVEEGDTAAARKHFEQTLDLMPHHTLASFHLGRLLESQGQLQEAVSHYHRAGAAQLKVGWTEQAISTYQSLLRIQPDSALAHNELGVALRGLGRVDEAIEHFRLAIRLRPDEAAIRENLDRALQTKAQSQTERNAEPTAKER